MFDPNRTVRLPDGETIPVFGLGTWRMGERGASRDEEIAALKLGLDLGVRVIDTAEMYGAGEAESVVGAAIAGRRDDVFIVSKVYPHNASTRGAVAACERSLHRLGTDRIDLYLLHWRGDIPLAETVGAFEMLKAAGKIRHWGVSNFDVDDLDELASAGGTRCAINQVLYNLESRGIEFDLLPAQAKAGMPVMAYSPLGQGPLLRQPALVAVAQGLGVEPATVALAWVLRQPNVMAIPKSVQTAHLKVNLAALTLDLGADTLAALDHAFKPPRRKTPLAMT